MSVLDLLHDDERDKLQGGGPGFAPLMLATLTHGAFADADWVFERKLDGERCLAVGAGGEVTLYSRNEHSLNHAYPELVRALERHGPEDFVADGEVVAFQDGVTSFQALQPRMQVDDPAEARATRVRVFYYLFDLRQLDHAWLEALPLTRRKTLLKRAFAFKDPLRYTTHRTTDGPALLEDACERGWEGLIAKDRHATYARSRSRSWLKLKCAARQEFVIGGYTEPKGSRTGFGALLLGYRDAGEMVYAGRVGTGFDEAALRDLARKLRGMKRRFSPFAGDVPDSAGVHWVRPELVCEVAFTEWTDAGRLRHPRFLGLRRDKDPEAVVREDESRGPDVG